MGLHFTKQLSDSFEDLSQLLFLSPLEQKIVEVQHNDSPPSQRIIAISDKLSSLSRLNGWKYEAELSRTTTLKRYDRVLHRNVITHTLKFTEGSCQIDKELQILFGSKREPTQGELDYYKHFVKNFPPYSHKCIPKLFNAHTGKSEFWTIVCMGNGTSQAYEYHYLSYFLTPSEKL